MQGFGDVGLEFRIQYFGHLAVDSGLRIRGSGVKV